MHVCSKVSDIDHMAAEKDSGVSQSASHLQFWGQDSKLVFRSESVLNYQRLLWTSNLKLISGGKFVSKIMFLSRNSHCSL